MRWKSHVRFGGRAGETTQRKLGKALRPDPYTEPITDDAVDPTSLDGRLLVSPSSSRPRSRKNSTAP